MLVAEEPGLHALDVCQPGPGDTLAQQGQHRGRDIDGHHAAHERRGGQSEPPGPGTEIDQGGGLANAVLSQHGEILGGIGISLLTVEARDERPIEMLRTGVRKLIKHPRPSHAGLRLPRHR